MHDLVKQQRLSKDSLRALESLGDKYDREKRELVIRLEKDKDDSIKIYEQKYESKVHSLKSINEQMSKKLIDLDETQEDLQSLQKSYNEAIQIIEDQKQQLQSIVADHEDLKSRNGQVEDELGDVQGML